MRFGNDAIAELMRFRTCIDASASSHWQSMLRGFRYDSRAVSAAGFGGYSGRRGLAPQILHDLLQRPYRRMARQYTGFESYDRAGRGVARRQGRIYDLDILRQAITLAFATHHLGPIPPASSCVVIGDGFGALSSLLLATQPDVTVIAVNLTPSLLLDFDFAHRSAPDAELVLPANEEEFRVIVGKTSRKRLVGVRADDARWIAHAPARLVFNVVSMQEMNPPIAAGYFDAMRAMTGETSFYCCNRVEKAHPDGTVMRFSDYPWREDDQIRADGPCPWHQFFYTMRLPLYRRYDGPIHHRLVVLAKDNGTGVA